MINTDKEYEVGEHAWLYIHEFPAPTGKKIHMLNPGGVSIDGFWDRSGKSIAWAPLHRRNLQKEAACVAWLKTNQASK